MGLEPTPGPWQGPVLPLYYDRPEQENSSTTAFRRQVPIAALGKRGYPHSPGQASANPGFITQPYSSTLRINANRQLLRGDQLTCSTRAVLTTGDLRWRSANLEALA